MAIAVLMPALSPTMEEGNIATWLKKEGDKIKSGDVIAEIETDKATMEVEATDSGTLAKILIPNGTKAVKVNALIAVILENGEDASAIDGIIAKYSGTKPAETKQLEANQLEIKQTENKQQTIATHSTYTQVIGEKSGVPLGSSPVFASPLAKRIAHDMGVNLAALQGSGPNGRIVRKDVELSTQNAAQNFGNRSNNANSLVLHSNMRRVIAKRLTESKHSIPHFYVSADVSVSKLNKVRKQMNEYLEKQGEKISVNDIIIKACAFALERHAGVNASWSEEGMIMYGNVDISVAVGIPDGLITPIVKNANIKGLRQISKEAKDLITKARDGKLSLEEFQGGGFTISNLGMYNISSFSAIINPPQSAILAIGGVKLVPYLSKKTGTIKEDEIITITLSCDHRVVDGVIAAEFLNTIKTMLENPSLMVL